MANNINQRTCPKTQGEKGSEAFPSLSPNAVSVVTARYQLLLPSTHVVLSRIGLPITTTTALTGRPVDPGKVVLVAPHIRCMHYSYDVDVVGDGVGSPRDRRGAIDLIRVSVDHTHRLTLLTLTYPLCDRRGRS